MAHLEISNLDLILLNQEIFPEQEMIEKRENDTIKKCDVVLRGDALEKWLH